MSEEKKKITAVPLTAGEAYEVSPLGSLGLLALGDLGLNAWRESREKAQAEKLESPAPEASAEDDNQDSEA
jgi:hypothetical protein